MEAFPLLLVWREEEGRVGAGAGAVCTPSPLLCPMSPLLPHQYPGPGSDRQPGPGTGSQGPVSAVCYQRDEKAVARGALHSQAQITAPSTL